MVSISGPMLNDKNYELWSIKMPTFLQLNKCWNMVEKEFTEPTAATLAAMTNANKKALNESRDRDLTAKWLIQSCIEESIFPRIAGATTAHHAWNLLQSAYKGTNRVKTVRLQTLNSNLKFLK